MLGRRGYLGIVGRRGKADVGEGRCGRDDGDWNLYFLAGEKKEDWMSSIQDARRKKMYSKEIHNHILAPSKIGLASSVLHQLTPSFPGNSYRSILSAFISTEYPASVGVV